MPGTTTLSTRAPLTPLHRRRLREVWRSAGWPCHDLIEVDLLAAGLLVFDQPYVFCTLLFFVKVFSDSGLATTWGTVTDIGGRATATVFAFNNAVAGIGSIVAPLLFGVIAENYGWRPVFATGAVCYLLCGLSWLIIDPRIPVLAEDERD